MLHIARYPPKANTYILVFRHMLVYMRYGSSLFLSLAKGFFT